MNRPALLFLAGVILLGLIGWGYFELADAIAPLVGTRP